MLKALFAASLLAATTSLYAQSPSVPPKRHDCSAAKDPKACEERRAKFREAHEKATAACKGKSGTEHRDCMRTQMCSQSQDPAKCEAAAKARAEKREQFRAAAKKAHAACEGKPAGERRDCMRHEMCAQSKDPAKCEAEAKARAERRQQQQKK